MWYTHLCTAGLVGCMGTAICIGGVAWMGVALVMGTAPGCFMVKSPNSPIC